MVVWPGCHLVPEASARSLLHPEDTGLPLSLPALLDSPWELVICIRLCAPHGKEALYPSECTVTTYCLSFMHNTYYSFLFVCVCVGYPARGQPLSTD